VPAAPSAAPPAAPAAPPLQALFIDGPSGARLFALYHPPAGLLPRGAVLYLHPFAEEMNKVRRMAAVQARALAAAGYAVLQPDLRGCGDSEGEFADSAWQDWLDDAVAAAHWLQQRHATLPLWLWGARAGALIAASIADRLPTPPHLLLWAAVARGRTHLQQFLRIKLAGALMDGGSGTGGGLAEMKATLEAGGTVDVAGYRLPGALANGLDAARLSVPSRRCRVVWLDVSSRAEPTLPPAAQRWTADCSAAGHAVQAAIVAGPAFWQTTEIEEAPALIDATLAALEAPAGEQA
jgi:exosortase A-associated hydrolase 2